MPSKRKETLLIACFLGTFLVQLERIREDSDRDVHKIRRIPALQDFNALGVVIGCQQTAEVGKLSSHFRIGQLSCFRIVH
jgi:hypothetical protein